MQDANDFMMQSGVPAAKFDAVGVMIKGVVLSAEVRDQTDFQSGAVLTWQNGDPRKQLVITLETEDTDAEIEGDDGARRIYAKGQMLNAIRAAVRAHGGIEEGGELAVKFIREEPSKTKGFNPTKVYQAWYKAPSKSVAVPAGGGAEEDEDASPF